MTNRIVAWTVVVIAGLAGCRRSESSSSPSAPSPLPPPAPPSSPIQVKGTVVDTASRGLANATVEVLTGVEAGTSITTDADGRFSLTGAFDTATQFRATRADHFPLTSSFVAPGGSVPWLYFRLQPVAEPVDIAGKYLFTLTADSSCDMLPSEFRTRTFDATIEHRDSRGSFVAPLSEATFAGPGRNLWIGVAGNYVHVDFSDSYIVEQPAPDTYLMIAGSGDGTASPDAATISGSLHALFDYCVTPLEMGVNYSCPTNAIAHAACRSPVTHWTLTRR